jgi:hypothetical protein
MEEKKSYSILPDWIHTKNEERLNLEGELSLINPNALSLFYGIIDYAEKYHTSYLPFDGLVKHLCDYGLKIGNPALKTQSSIIEIFKSIYLLLVKKKYCQPELVVKKVVAIILRDPKSPTVDDIKKILENLKNEYEKCSTEEKRPFPSESHFPNFHFYPDVVYVLSLKEFAEKFFSDIKIEQPLCKILLPENQDIFLPSEFFNQLFDFALLKLQLFLSYSESSNLLFKKLKEKFSSLKMLNSMKDLFPLARAEHEILAAITTEILGFTSIEKDLAIWQSCQIVQAIAFKKGVETQRKTIEKGTFDIFLKIAEKTPSFFNRSSLLKLRDSYSNFRVFSLENYIKIVDQFLSEYSSKDASLPLIFAELHNERVYIHRNNFYKHLIDFLDKLFIDLHKKFSDEYTKNAKAFLKKAFIQSEEAFNEYVNEIVNKENSFVVYYLKDALSLYKILLFCESNNYDAKGIVKRFFTVKENGEVILRPFSKIIGLDYQKIIKEAKVFLPFFEQFNFFSWIFSLFRKFAERFDKALDSQLKAKKELPALSEIIHPVISSVKEKKTIPETASEKEGKQQKTKKEKALSYLKSLEEFKDEMIGNSSVEEMLSLYESRWNHILNKKTREDNLKYVKDKIANRIKFIKKPTVENILQEVENIIITDKNLQQLTDQNALKKYITLVFIEYFLKKQK